VLLNVRGALKIFQAGSPVLVGVEPLSTYVYLMNPSEKRD